MTSSAQSPLLRNAKVGTPTQCSYMSVRAPHWRSCPLNALCHQPWRLPLRRDGEPGRLHTYDSQETCGSDHSRAADSGQGWIRACCRGLKCQNKHPGRINCGSIRSNAQHGLFSSQRSDPTKNSCFVAAQADDKAGRHRDGRWRFAVTDHQELNATLQPCIQQEAPSPTAASACSTARIVRTRYILYTYRLYSVSRELSSKDLWAMSIMQSTFCRLKIGETRPWPRRREAHARRSSHPLHKPTRRKPGVSGSA